MSFQLKSVFISDDVDPRCVEILKENGVQVVMDTKLRLDKEKFLAEMPVCRQVCILCLERTKNKYLWLWNLINLRGRLITFFLNVLISFNVKQ